MNDKPNGVFDFWAGVAGIFLLPFFIVSDLISGAIKLGNVFFNSPQKQEARLKQLNEELYQEALNRDIVDRDEFVKSIIAELEYPLTDELADYQIQACKDIFDNEELGITKPPLVANSVEGARYRDKLSKVRDPKPVRDALIESFRNLETELVVEPLGVEFQMKLRDFATPRMVEKMILPFYGREGYFEHSKRQFDRNLHRLSNIPLTPEHQHSPKLVLPEDYKGQEHITKYLTGTPLDKVFNARVPFVIPTKRRVEHMHILGGSGAGKTQLIQQLIMHDIEEGNSIVVVDSQSDLIRTISKLKLDRDPIIISPRHMPSLNIFDVPDRGGDEDMQNQIANGVIDTYMYVFDGLVGADLTAKQGVFFKMVARLLLELPKTFGRNATIMDMFDLMESDAPYREAINNLRPINRNFFQKDFQATTFRQTKEQIRYRLNAILENPTIAELFTAQENKIDLLDEMGKGSIILVDTNKEFLKSNSAHFGRFFISLVLRAAFERASITRRPMAMLYVDEAAEYFDSNINDLLTSVRKYNVGCVFAHQFLEQCTPSLRASLSTNTAIKCVGGGSTADARALASDLRTNAEFILNQPPLHFATYVRGMKTAVSLQVDAGMMERADKREDYAEMIQRNFMRIRIPQKSPADGPDFIPDGVFDPKDNPLDPITDW